MATNHAAYILKEKEIPVQVLDAPMPKVEPATILIKVGALAINPIDWKIQYYAIFPFRYPLVMGEDVAGEVVEVGEGVTRFKVGQRVLGLGLGMSQDPKHSGNSYAGFQEYMLLSEITATPIPDSVAYEEATVLPLALATAASGLFDPKFLGLPLSALKPSLPPLRPTPTGRTLIVWGASSSVGMMAVRLATDAGAEVVATASKHNFQLIRSLGAAIVFDHNSPTVVQDMVSYLKKKEIVGAYDTISVEETQSKTAEVLIGANAAIKFICFTMPPVADLKTVKGEATSFLNVFKNNIGTIIYRDYLPEALATGHLKPVPKPLIVGKGLECVQEAMEKSRAGLSAKKAVVKLL
ncbi:chaperonin 10-like protein [Dipodascopsis uninucleata]